MQNDEYLDLSPDATQEYFEERELAEAIGVMESVEYWTRDRYEEVQQVLDRLALTVEQADLETVSPEMQRSLIHLLGYISSGKAIRLLMWMEGKHPTFVAKTMTEAHLLTMGDTGGLSADDGSGGKDRLASAKLFLERFYVLERDNVLSRVFSGRRLQLISDVLECLRVDENDNAMERSR